MLKIAKLLRFCKKVLAILLNRFAILIPICRVILETKNTQTPVYLSHYFVQKILGINKNAYWPMHFSSKVFGVRNIVIGVETCPGYMPGCYIQAESKIVIGDYTQVGPGVGLISTNHKVEDNRVNVDKGGIEIGAYCWLGMNSVILSGVKLGDFTIVGAGAVVTKSFEEGYSIIAGNPATIIRKLDVEKCVRHKSAIEYIGFLKKI